MRSKGLRKGIIVGAMIALVAITVPMMYGCTTATPEPTEEPIVVGFIGSFAGDGSVSCMRAVEIAVDEFNEAGGIFGGRTIKFVTADSAESSNEGIKALDYLVQDEGVDFILNSAIDDVTLGLLPRMSEYRVPTITVWTSAYNAYQSITEDYDKWKWYFGKQNDAFTTASMLQYAIFTKDEFGWENTVILQEDTAYGEAVAGWFEEEVGPVAGIEVLDRIVYDVDTVDFSPIFSKIKDANPDFTYLISSVKDIVPCAQYVKQEVPIPLTGLICSSFNPEFWEDTGGMAAGITVFSLAPTYSFDLDPWTQAFLDKYEANYPSRPRQPWFTGFLAYYGMYEAIEAAERVYEAGLGSGFEPLDAWVEEMYDTHMTIWKYGGRERRDDLSPTGEDEIFFTNEYYRPGEIEPVTGMEWPGSMKYDPTLKEGSHYGCAIHWYTDGTTKCVWPEVYKNGELPK